MKKSNSKTVEQLHNNFERDVKLQGKSVNTISSYTRALRRLLTYFDCHPKELTQEDLKLYFDDLLNARSWSTVKVDLCGLRHFWERILKIKWPWPELIKPPREKKLPDILTIEEVDRIMAALDKFRYRVCLFTIYSMGLRLTEGTTLKVSDIDSARMLVHIRSAKGNKDRMVPLPQQTLLLLRRYWSTHKNPHLLFPSVQYGPTKKMHTDKPMEKGGVQTAFKLALSDCNIHKKASVHTLRHSYATHLVESGVNLRVIQEILGHTNPNTTVLYARLSKPTLDDSGQRIQTLINRFQFVTRKQLVIPQRD